jgi:hypothetical protein
MKNPYYDVSEFQLSDYPHTEYYGHPSKAFAVDEKRTKLLGMRKVSVQIPVLQESGKTRHLTEEREAPHFSGTDVVARIYDMRPGSNNAVLAEKTFRATGSPRDHDEELRMAAEQRRLADAWLRDTLPKYRWDNLGASDDA